MRLILDMNLSLRWVTCFRDNGIEAQHWSSVGSATTPDRKIMDYAKTHDMVVVTHDLDFGAILASNRRRQAQCRPDEGHRHFARDDWKAPCAALKVNEVDLSAGALLTIGVTRNRVRLLPLVESGDH